MLFEPNDQGLILGKNPHTIGHEASGTVVKKGTGAVASQFKLGDNVGFLCAVECCFECAPCKAVHNSWCKTGKTQMQGFSLDGYFQEYAVVDARATMVLPAETTTIIETRPAVTDTQVVTETTILPADPQIITETTVLPIVTETFFGTETIVQTLPIETSTSISVVERVVTEV